MPPPAQSLFSLNNFELDFLLLGPQSPASSRNHVAFLILSFPSFVSLYGLFGPHILTLCCSYLSPLSSWSSAVC